MTGKIAKALGRVERRLHKQIERCSRCVAAEQNQRIEGLMLEQIVRRRHGGR